MSVQPLSPEELQDVRAMLDKRKITDLIHLYGRAVDRKDYALLDQIYWPDATDDHIAYSGDVAGFKAWLAEFASQMTTTHFIGNIVIEFLGASEAFVETYVIGFHDLAAEDGGRADLVVGGRYLDRWEKRGDEWRIARRDVTADFQFQGPSTADWGGLFETLKTRGTSMPNDPLYRFHPMLAAAE